MKNKKKNEKRKTAKAGSDSVASAAPSVLDEASPRGSIDGADAEP